MQIAQRLYEGVDIGDGAVGLITYMRTDGVDLAPEAVAAARARHRQGLRRRLRAGRAAQLYHQGQERAGGARSDPPDRHDAGPARCSRHLEPEQAKLYELIWTRAIACQMESAELERTTVDILAEAGARKLDFRGERPGRALSRFPGALSGRPGRRRGRGNEPSAAHARRREADARSASTRPSTSPSRRRATPRRRWSSAWRSSASAVPRPTPRPSRCCATATTCGSRRSGSSRRTRAGW